MAVNLKIASVVIATLAITFSSFTLVRFTINFQPKGYGENSPKQGKLIDNGGVVPKAEPEGEPWADQKPSPITTTTKPSKAERYAELSAKFNRTPTVAERIIGAVVALVSIVTAFMIFGTVSDDNEHNQMKRHAILPFVIYHSLLSLFHVFALIYVCITYRDYFDVLLMPLLVYLSVIFVTIVGISFVAAYHKSLSRMAGFSYAQMEDVQKQIPDHEVKIPLA